ASSLTPSVSASGGGVSLLQGPLGLALLVVAALVAGVALTYRVVMIFGREDRLSVVLKPYDEALASPVVSGADDDDPTTSLARTALVQRAVQLTEQVAEQRGMLTRAETALERANLPLRAGEALFFYAAL